VSNLVSIGFNSLIHGRDNMSLGASGTHRIIFLSNAFVLTCLLQHAGIQWVPSWPVSHQR